MRNDAFPTTGDRAFDLPRLCRYFCDLSPQPMVAVEGATHIVRHANAAFLHLVGADRSNLVGHPFAMAMPEGVANPCMPMLDRVFCTGTSERLAEQKHGEQSPAYWSYTAWAILGGDEHPVGVMIQVSDATEVSTFRDHAMKMNEELLLSSVRQHELAEIAETLNTRLQAAIKEKEYFIAVLSHELRTPLTPILLAASLLQEDQRLNPETQAIMQMIHRNVTLEARLIDDLLDMTRMGRGKLNLERVPIDLREVLERAIEACRPDLNAGKLTLEVDIASSPQMVKADASRLQQVFSNLLSNAIKFTPAGGRVRIGSRRDGDSFVAEVSDNGAGIDAEFLSKAFFAFEQGNKTHTRKPGMGLGLAICKSIVELHDGSITAKSEGKNRGATFVVRLPLLPQEQMQPEEVDATPPEKPHSLESLHILLVEDHADTAEMLRRMLATEGYSVNLASDVAGALKLAATQKFDLLLSDMGLPDGTGADLMRILRKQGSTLPGIVLSGYGQDDDIRRSLEAGFAAHLVKPLNNQKIQQAIQTVIGG